MPSPHRILVVANRTCPRPALRDEIKLRTDEHDAAEVLIVAPALNSSKLAHWVSDTDEAVGEAELRLAETVEALRRTGVEASGRVGDGDPFNAIQDSLGVFDAHEVLISTHPPGDSHWLEADLPGRTREACDGPVAHITSEYGLVPAT